MVTKFLVKTPEKAFKIEIKLLMYHVIYDGNCNLCVNFTRLLEQFDRGQIFNYIPMQETTILESFGITSQDCQMGMILINGDDTCQRWQGSAAAEEIISLLPMGEIFILAYRSLPGAKWFGDRTYEQIRDHRYQLFGGREETYYPIYPFGCSSPNQEKNPI
jgi:predicted DCC family thiol-disulfide oxidoreductase YuxK